MTKLSAIPLLVLYAASAGWGKVVYVNANAAGPVHDGSSWATALTTIAAARGLATSGDEVWVAASMPAAPAYTGGFILHTGASLYGGFVGSETSRDQRDARANPTVIEPPKDATGVTLAGATIDGFTIRNGSRSAVWVTGPATVSHNIISNNDRTTSSNSTPQVGGGIVVVSGQVTIANNTITGNVSDKGAAVYIEAGAVTLTNNLIARNQALTSGGAVYAAGGTLTMVNNTIAANTGPVAVVYVLGASTPTFVNNLVAGNSSGIYPVNTPAAFRNNNVWSNGGFNYKGVTDPTGTNGNISVDPMVSSLYRSPHLQPGSPCINAGSTTDDPGAEDIDGQARVQDGRVDIGADEWDGTTTPVNPSVIRVSPAGDDANDGSSWGSSKRTLAAALAVAQPDDEVWAAAGAYPEKISIPMGVALYGGFAGTESLREQRNWNANRTVLDGRLTGTSVVTIASAGATLDGVVIRNAPLIGISISRGSAAISHTIVTGGIEMAISVAGGSATLTNSTLVANRNAGLYADGGSSAVLNGVTIAGNGGIGVGGRDAIAVTVRNSVIAFNRYGIQSSPGNCDLRFNDVYGNPGGNFLGVPDPTGTNGNISADPLLSDIHRDVHLQPGSPCIDTGGEAEGASDIDGQPRLQGARVDMGSDEWDGSTTVPPAPRVIRVSPDGDDARDGSSWETARKTIGAALADAGYGDEVWVSAGLFREDVRLPLGVALHGGFAGTESSRGQRADAFGLTTLDGGRDGDAGTTYQPSTVTGYRDNTVDGFTIRNGWGGASLTDGTITNNAIIDQAGTGVWVSGITVVDHNLIAGNSAGQGAGILAGQGTATITHNTIMDNTATVGGGVTVSPGGTAMVANNLIARNHALQGSGGGVYSRGDALTLLNNTIVANTASASGGAISAQMEAVAVTMSNNIVAGNSSGIALQISGAAAFRHNDVWGNGTSNYDGVADPTGTNGNLSLDPAFAAPGNWRLSAASPCLNAGDSALIPAGDTDLDGRPRLAGAAVDMGAYEYVSAPAFAMADVVHALRMAAGLQAATVADSRLNLDGDPRLTLGDAARLVRIATGLDSAP